MHRAHRIDPALIQTRQSSCTPHSLLRHMRAAVPPSLPDTRELHQVVVQALTRVPPPRVQHVSCRPQSRELRPHRWARRPRPGTRRRRCGVQWRGSRARPEGCRHVGHALTSHPVTHGLYMRDISNYVRTLTVAHGAGYLARVFSRHITLHQSHRLGI